MKTALILIDIQNDYFPTGRMELEGSIEASLRAGEALIHFREAALPVIHVQHISMSPKATFFLPGTDGIEIHENVRPLPNEITIQKAYPNSFRDTTLLEHLRTEGIGRLAIAGMMTHMCVDATTRAAFDDGFECVILGDACATRSLSYQGAVIPAQHVHGSFLAALETVYGRVISVDGFLAELK
jgi:nicotinamidase-related amidase